MAVDKFKCTSACISRVLHQLILNLFYDSCCDLSAFHYYPSATDVLSPVRP